MHDCDKQNPNVHISEAFVSKHTWAMKMTVRASKKAVPFMLMVAPKGSTKRAMGSLMPCSAAQRSVTGRLAMLESVANTVTSAGAKALQR